MNKKKDMELKNKKAAMHNLGCKVNSYEAEAMIRELREAGVEIVSWDKDKADIYIINTCSVTNIADRKSRQMIHKARAMNPDAVVIAAGCYVQAKAEELKYDNAVDILLGNNEKGNLVSAIEKYYLGEADEEGSFNNRQEYESVTSVTTGNNIGGSEESFSKGGFTETVSVGTAESNSERRNFKSRTSCYVKDILKDQSYEDLRAGEIEDNGRVFLKVQDGCNQYCSYCIIPYVRGRIRSRSVESTVKEVADFAKRGYHEIVLTGIHLSSYGLDFDNANYEFAMENDVPSEHLLELIRSVANVPGINRVRLGSLEPRIITEAFIEELKKIPEVCPHFHLSLQSGCDRTLKAMNRHYDTAAFRHSVELIRKAWDDAAVTTDVIVGFPGETEEDFRESYDFIDETGFYELHVFKYSRRQGTVADKMKDQVPDKIKSERSEKLIRLDETKSEVFRRSFLDKESEIIPEDIITFGEKKYLRGYNKSYVRFMVPLTNDEEGTGKIGQIIRVQGQELCETCVLALIL